MIGGRERIGITDAVALTLWFRSRVGSYYTVRFEHGAETAYVTRKPSPLCVIPTPNEEMTLRDAIRLRGFAIHESGHPRHHPEIFEILETQPTKQGSPLASIFNCLLDVHNETHSAMEFAGDAKALSEFAAVVGRDVYEKLSKQFKVAGSVWPPNFAKMASVMIAARNAEMTWNVGMHIGFERLVEDLYTQEMRDKALEIERKFKLTRRLVENYDKENGQSIFDLSKEIFQFLWPEENVDDQLVTPPSKGKGEGKGEGKEGEPQPGTPKPDESGEESNATSSGSEGEGDKESLEDQLAKEKIKIDELLFSDHYELQEGGRGSGIGFDYAGYQKHSVYHPVDPASFKVIEYGRR